MKMNTKALKLLFALTVALAVLFICTLSASAALLGDIDGNSLIEAADARTILRASVGLETLTDEQTKLADIDADGRLSAADARSALRISVLLDPVLHYYTGEITKTPTCTETGTELFTCTECEEAYEKELAALGHNFPAPEILTEVTCETDGLEKYTCQRENCTHTEERTVPAGHVPDIPEATCTETQLCTRGNHIMAEPLGHTADWGVCDRCKIYNTEKYAAEAEIIKAKFNEAKSAFNAAYAINSYNAMIDGVSWKVLPNTRAAKPDYIKTKSAYEAAITACGEIPELAKIKSLLQKNLANINGVLSQVELILAEDFFDTRNFEALVWPLEELNDFNSDSINSTNKKLAKLIVW